MTFPVGRHPDELHRQHGRPSRPLPRLQLRVHGRNSLSLWPQNFLQLEVGARHVLSDIIETDNETTEAIF
jgi:hypothetical protein